MARIAFLGLGRMGQGMAGRLLDAGHSVTLWNRSPAKAAGLVGRGARLTPTPAEAAREADAVLAMMADDAASDAAWLGGDGALATARRGALAIECSTLSHPFLLRLADTARARGLTFIDCPVTGRPDAAAAGKLTLLVGAEPADLERARPLLAAISEKIRHMGPVGQGTGYKLMINLMGAVQIAALAEGLALCDRLGLDRMAVMEAIADSAAASRQVVYHVRRMAKGDYADPTFTAALRHKDAACGMELARRLGVPARLGETATGWFEATKRADPDGDEARVLETIRAVTGGPAE